jgi:L-asparaginase
MTLRVIATGGTFDKLYDEISGKLVFGTSNLPAAIARARITLPVQFEQLPPLDSLDMQDVDRQRILTSCRSAQEEQVVIVHGTDTMRETAGVLGLAKLAKTIVLTGAMVPYSAADSDALFNFGFACGAVQALPHGVYVAMNGRIFNWDKVVKDRAAGVFLPSA